MIAGQKNSLIMLVLLGVSIFIYNLGIGICYARGLEPLPAVDFLYQVVFICGTVWWLQAEVKESAVTRVYCPGVLIAAACPSSLPITSSKHAASEACSRCSH